MRSSMRYDQLSPVPPLTYITRILIIMCSVSYVLDFVLTRLGFRIGGLELSQIFGLVPYLVQEKGWLWQFVTYIFMHGSPLHLLLNMMILWYFGAELEMRFGSKGFLRYFLVCGIGAGAFNFAVNYFARTGVPSMQPIIGASGAIYGILAAYGIFFGERYFLVFFLFPMKARYFVLVIAAIELFTGVDSGVQDDIAHFAHIGGMLIGASYIYIVYLFPQRRKGKDYKDAERERLKKQFTLIVNEKNDGARKDDEGGGPYWN